MDLERLAEEYERGRRIAEDATLDLHSVGTRWEADPTPEHREATLAAVDDALRTMRDQIEVMNRYIARADGVLKPQAVDVLKYGRTELLTQFGQANLYRRKVLGQEG